MRILVTGAAGYIGSVLCPMLLEAGHNVIALDSFRYGQAGAFASVAYDWRLDIVRGDARNPTLLRRLVPEVDAVIPLAALVGAPLCDRYPDEAEAINVASVVIIRDMLRPNQRLIYPNTNSGYGISHNGEPLTEDKPLNPISLYGKLKCFSEREVFMHPRGVTLRLATVYGASPRMRTDLLVNDFVLRAVRDKSLVMFEPGHKRSIVHVRDVAQAFVHALSDTVPAGAYNVASANVTKLELATQIAEKVPGFTAVENEFAKDPDQRDYAVSSVKLLATGFRYWHSLDRGIEELVKFYQSFPSYPWGNL